MFFRVRASRRPFLLFAAACVMSLAALPAAASATPGALDLTFGNGGLLQLAQPQTKATETVLAAIPQPDGTILTPTLWYNGAEYGDDEYGYSFLGRKAPKQKFYISRRLANGAVDPTFPRTVAQQLPPYFVPQTTEQLADGRIVIVGATYGLRPRGHTARIEIFRFTAAGLPDSTYGVGGRASFAPTKLPNGVVEEDWYGSLGESTAVAPDGRVFMHVRNHLGRYAYDPDDTRNLLVAVTAAGTLDSAFGGGSVLLPKRTGSDATEAFSLAVGPGGSLYVFEQTRLRGIGDTQTDVTIRRFGADGVIDTAFAGGAVELPTGTNRRYTGRPGLKVLASGEILARTTVQNEATAGKKGSRVVTTMELRRYDSSGSVVASFGTSGVATVGLGHTSSECCYSFDSTFGFADYGPGIVMQADGKLLLPIVKSSGAENGPDNEELDQYVYRMTANGSLDTTYDKLGAARVDGMPRLVDYEFLSDARLTSSGSLLLLGSTFSNDDDGRSQQTVAQLTAGDAASPATSSTLRVVGMGGCGSSARKPCPRANGKIALGGRVTSAGTAVAGARVRVTLVRSSPGSGQSPLVLMAKTDASGAFVVRSSTARRGVRAGAWKAAVDVLAGPSNQRADASAPVFFVLGPRRLLVLERAVFSAQVSAVEAFEVVTDNTTYDRATDTEIFCTSLEACFGDAPKLLARAVVGSQPGPGQIGVVFGKGGKTFQLISRVATDEFRLEFVYGVDKNEDQILTCRGSARARANWCPGKTWNTDAAEAALYASEEDED